MSDLDEMDWGAAYQLRAAATEIERELICCDVFERLSMKPVAEWNADERRESQRHAICYWGAAARRLVIDRAERLEDATSPLSP